MPRTKTSRSSRPKSAPRAKKQPNILERFMRWRYAKPVTFAVIFAVIGLGAVFITFAAAPKGQIVGKASGKCIDNHSDRRVNQNPIILYPCSDNNAAQVWTLESDKSIRMGKNFCLDVVWGSVKPKTAVWLYKCSTPVNGAQQWVVQSNGTIKNPRSGLCLEARGRKTATGTRLWINTCDGNSSQIWKVPQVINPLPTPEPTVPTPTPEPTPAPTPSTDSGTSGLTFPTCSALGPKTDLTAHGGSFWSDQGTASGKAIAGDLILDSSTPTYATSNFSVQGKVKNELSGGSLTVEDFLVRAPSYSGDWGLGHHNVTARRFRIENHSDGIRVAGTGNSLYEDFCITGVSQSGDHSDGIQSYGASNSNFTLRRGIITMPSSNATAGVFAADGVTGSITIDTVLFIGGPYGIRINSDGGGPIALRNVRFRKGSFGAAPFAIASNIRITEWTNVAYEDGTPIPPPHAVQP